MAWWRFGDLSLRWKSLALLLAASTGPLLVASVLALAGMRRTALADATALLGARADQLADDLDGFHERYLASAARLSRSPAVVRFYALPPSARGREGGDLHEIITSYLETDPNIFGVALLDAAGRAIDASQPRWVGLDLSFRAFFREAREGEAVISDLFVTLPTTAPAPVISYASPVFAPGGRVLGVVSLTVRAGAFWRAVGEGNGRAGAGSYSVLFDRHGIRIAHSFRAQDVFRPAGRLGPALVDAMVAERRFGPETRRLLEESVPMEQEFSRVLAPVISREEVFRGHSEANGQVNLGVARRLKRVPWTLFYLVPEASIEAPVQRLAVATLFPSALLVVAALALGLLVIRHILRPVGALARAANAIAAGDPGARVSVETGDEMGLLARRFNEMAAAIQAGRENLEARIRERTGDLSRANEELQAQKRELLAQQEELEAQRVELESKNLEVQRADRLKSEFLTNMSHELRTPLNSVIGFSDLLLDDLRREGPPLHVQYLEDILASGRHLLDLINDILDLSKIEAGHLKLEVEALDPAGAVADACAIVEAAARRKRIDVRQVVHAKRPVLADRGKLRQILLNLLSNSVKFAPEGSMVEVGATDIDSFVRFHVRDEGPGIDPAVQPRLFEAFVQGESPLVKKHQGTGLGLAISKRLVEMQRGTISVRSDPGRGAVFRFTMPLATEAEEGRGVGGAEGEERPLVLLVEGDREAAGILREWLEREGCRVAEASNGDALALAVSRRPAAIVLDPAAEERDDLRLLDELRRCEATRDIPVIVTSLPAPAGWLAKPVDRERLLGALGACRTAVGGPPLVLVIDDDPGARRLLRGLLEPAGYRVIEADGGRSGLELALSSRPGLCIVDLLMPDMSGFEVVAALAGDPRTRGMPIVVLTAADLSEADCRRLKEHVRALARKGTVTREEVLAAVRRAVGRAPAAATSGKTVLVVDDHDLNRELARTLLERRGYRVLTAEDGDSGVAIALRERPALVLMDLAMPGKDGYAAARELKAAPETAKIPVVALTALAMRGDEQKAYAAGFDAYVTKPIDRQALEAVVARFVARSASDGALPPR